MVSILRATYLPVAVWSIQSGKKVSANESASVRAQIKQTKVLAHLLFPNNEIEIDEFKLDRDVEPLFPFPKEVRFNITKKELIVGQLISQHLSNEVICERMGLNKNTVRSHIKSLYKKTKSNDRKELIEWFKELV